MTSGALGKKFMHNSTLSARFPHGRKKLLRARRFYSMLFAVMQNMKLFEILIRPASFLFVFFGAYFLKRAGLFGERDHSVVSKLVINVTLPATVIVSFSGAEVTAQMLLIVALGFACALTPMILAYFLTRGQEKSRRVFRMLNAAGYNVGCFTTPFVQGYFGGEGAIISSMFDTGNALMVTGGSYTIVSTLLRTGSGRETPWTVCKKFLTSAPFVAYIGMMALALAGVHPGEALVSFLTPISSSNAFLAMAMLGLAFSPVHDKTKQGDLVRLLCWRVALCGAFSAALYFLTPFPLAVRQVLALTAFSPISALGPVYTERCGGDTGLASFANSISILISLVVMTVLVTIFKM